MKPCLQGARLTASDTIQHWLYVTGIGAFAQRSKDQYLSNLLSEWMAGLGKLLPTACWSIFILDRWAVLFQMGGQYAGEFCVYFRWLSFSLLRQNLPH